MKVKEIAIIVFSMFLFFGAKANAAAVAHSCNVIHVMSYPGVRVHIHCEQAFNTNILYFSLPARTADEVQYANQMISIGMAALSMNKKVGFNFDDADTSGAAFGCVAANCRKVGGVYIAR